MHDHHSEFFATALRQSPEYRLFCRFFNSVFALVSLLKPIVTPTEAAQGKQPA